MIHVKMFDIPQKSDPEVAPVALFFKYVHHWMRNEKLGKVSCFDDPQLNVG